MPPPHGSRVPAFVAAVLVLGLAAPVLADVAPPPPPEQPTPEPPPKLAEQPPAEPPAKPAESADKPKAESKTGSCSIDENPEHGLLGLAGLVLLISGASLRRRRA